MNFLKRKEEERRINGGRWGEEERRNRWGKTSVRYFFPVSKLEDVNAAPPALLALPCGCVLRSEATASLTMRLQCEHGG